MNTRCWLSIISGLIFVTACFGVAVAEDLITKELELEELWSIGGEEDDDVLLEFICSVVRQDDDIYILDTVASKIHHYTVNGDFVAIYDVAGSGPGQCSSPNDLLGLGDGKFGLVNGLPAKIIVTDLKDNPRPTIKFYIPTVPDNSPLRVYAIKSQGNYLGVFSHVMRQGIALSIFEFRDNEYGYPQAHELARLLHDTPLVTNEVPSEIDIPYYFNREVWNISTTGQLYVAPYRDRYLINVYNPDGSLAFQIEGDYNPCERSYDLMDYYSYSVMGKRPYVESYEPAIMGVDIVDDQLWVRTGCSDQHDVYRQYDVYDLQGNFSQRVNLNYKGDGFKDNLVFLGDGLVAIVKGYYDMQHREFFSENPHSPIEEDVSQVIMCRIK